MEERNKLFHQDLEAAERGKAFSPEEEYRFLVETNSIMEKALEQTMPKEEFDALRGKYILKEACGSLERANAAVQCEEGQEGSQEND
jgi:hypothetical protein